MKIQDVAYVLHRRPYRDTSLLVDFFTQHHGVITAVCRGTRQNKKNIALACFHPFWIEYGSRNSLATLYQYESDANLSYSAVNLSGSQLYCGLYLNELLVKLLGRHDPYSELFLSYQMTLNGLQDGENIERILRIFEFYLLKEIGYGISLEKEKDTHQPIVEEQRYYYHPGMGFSAIKTPCAQILSFNGRSIMEMAKGNFSESATLKDAKRLIRLTLDFLLEKQGKLKSRELFLR